MSFFRFVGENVFPPFISKVIGVNSVLLFSDMKAVDIMAESIGNPTQISNSSVLLTALKALQGVE